MTNAEDAEKSFSWKWPRLITPQSESVGIQSTFDFVANNCHIRAGSHVFFWFFGDSAGQQKWTPLLYTVWLCRTRGYSGRRACRMSLKFANRKNYTVDKRYNSAVLLLFTYYSLLTTLYLLLFPYYSILTILCLLLYLHLALCARRKTKENSLSSCRK